MRVRYVFAALASYSAVTGQQPECTAEEDGSYFDLTPLKAKTDYEFKSDTGRLFKLNVCGPVVSETWKLENPGSVGGFYRGAHSDLSMGTVNSTLRIADSHPLLILSDGSPCGGDGSAIRAATAVRFICDKDVFGAGQPQLVAQLPPDDDSACAFFVEWRTHVACPTAKPGGIGGIVAIIAAVVFTLFLSYIVVGILYRRVVLGYRGVDQFPRISLIPLSSLPHSLEDFLDWLRDIRDHLRGGARDLWPRSRTTTANGPRASNWGRRNDGFAPLAREEEEAMFRDHDHDHNGPDAPDARFSLEDEADLQGAQELTDSTPPVPAKDGDKDSGPIRL